MIKKREIIADHPTLSSHESRRLWNPVPGGSIYRMIAIAKMKIVIRIREEESREARCQPLPFLINVRDPLVISNRNNYRIVAKGATHQ